MGQSEVVYQFLVGRCLFEGAQLFALDVLDQRVRQLPFVTMLWPDDGCHRGPTRQTAGSEPTLAGQEHIPSLRVLHHHDRLEKADLGNGRGQLLEGSLVERPTGLARVRADIVKRDLPIHRSIAFSLGDECAQALAKAASSVVHGSSPSSCRAKNSAARCR